MPPPDEKLTQENAALRIRLEEVMAENKLLREKIDLLVKRIFGAKSEQLDNQQLMLLLQGGDGEAKSSRLRRGSRRPGG